MSAGLQSSWDTIDKGRLFLMMPLGSLTLRAMFYPATLVKTRLMASDAYTGTAHAFRTIVRTEGMLALYKGFSVSLLGLFIGPVYISTLEVSKSVLMHNLPLDSSTTQTCIPMVAGAVASIVGQTVSVPVDIVSQRRMMQSTTTDGVRASAASIVRTLWKEGGVKAFYRGYVVSLVTYVPSSSIIWGTVHQVQGPLGRLWPRAPATTTTLSRWDGVVRDVTICMASGAIAGTTSAVLLNPLDVVRTRMQVLDGRPAGFISTVQDLVRERGMRGFASGISARVLTLAPLFTMIIGGYEIIKRACAKDARMLHAETVLSPNRNT